MPPADNMFRFFIITREKPFCKAKATSQSVSNSRQGREYISILCGYPFRRGGPHYRSKRRVYILRFARLKRLQGSFCNILLQKGFSLVIIKKTTRTEAEP